MTVDLDSPRAPWRGPRCHTPAEPDPNHPDALIITHRPGCRTPTGVEAVHASTTG